MARPSTYTQETAEAICNRIATSSDGLRTICEDEGMPAMSTIFKWLKEHTEFSEQYARAREAQADYLADEIISISNDNTRDAEAFVGANHVNRARLRVDAYKWKASKLAPKRYGDSLIHKGDEDNPVAVKVTLKLKGDS